MIDDFKSVIPRKTGYRFFDPGRNIIITDSSGLGVSLSGVVLSSMFSSSDPIVGDIAGGRFNYMKDTDENKATVKNAVSAMKI